MKDQWKKEESDAVKEYLKKGGKITVCPPNQYTPQEEITYTYKAGSRGRKKSQSK